MASLHNQSASSLNPDTSRSTTLSTHPQNLPSLRLETSVSLQPTHSSTPSMSASVSPLREACQDVTYGSVAGIIGKYVEYPFDTVKVRLQSQPDHLPLRYTGPLDCFRQSLQADGVRGLYRGITAPLVGAAAETSSLFFFEKLGRDLLVMSGVAGGGGGGGGGAGADVALTLPQLWFTGAFSGGLTSFVLTPIELVKCRVQAAGMHPPLSQSTSSTSSSLSVSSSRSPSSTVTPMSVVRSVFRHQGLLGFWRGQMGTLIREAGGSSAWFGAKETVTQYFYRQRVAAAAGGPGSQYQVDQATAQAIRATPLPFWQQAIAGASAGVSYNFLFYPADTIKSRIQTLPIAHTPSETLPATVPPPTTPLGKTASTPTVTMSHTISPSFWSEARYVWQRQGLRGFYRGCGITCLRSAPSSAFIFMVYDGLRYYLPW